MEKVEQKNGGAFVTLESMRAEFNSRAWKDLGRPKSEFSKFLLSPFFKSEGLSEDQIDSKLLKIFALLHSPGLVEDRVDYMVKLLQAGNSKDGKHIYANDDEFASLFTKMCRFSSSELFEHTVTIGAVKEIYDEQEISDIDDEI